MLLLFHYFWLLYLQGSYKQTFTIQTSQQQPFKEEKSCLSFLRFWGVEQKTIDAKLKFNGGAMLFKTSVETHKRYNNGSYSVFIPLRRLLSMEARVCMLYNIYETLPIGTRASSSTILH